MYDNENKHKLEILKLSKVYFFVKLISVIVH